MSFPKKVVIRTAIPGVNSEDRKVLGGITTANMSTYVAPVTASEGILLNRNQYIHIFFNVTADSPNTVFYVQLYWYSPVSDQWHKGERLAVNDDDVSTIEVQGLSRLYLHVDTINEDSSESGTPSIDAWVGLVVPV